MILIMTEIGAFLIFAFSAWYFLYRVVPRLGQWTTLCLLHNRRDQLYDLREKSEVGEESLIYQDMLFSLTLLIHLVRNKPWRTTLPILVRILDIRSRSKSAVEDGFDWRSRRYEHECKVLFSGEAGQAELRGALRVFREKDLVLSLYAVTSHPILFIFALSISGMSILIAPTVYYYRLCVHGLNRIDVKSVGKTLDSIRIYQDGDSMGHSYG
jgi:hypothetical protein